MQGSAVCRHARPKALLLINRALLILPQGSASYASYAGAPEEFAQQVDYEQHLQQDQADARAAVGGWEGAGARDLALEDEQVR